MLLNLQCCHCAADSAYRDVLRPRPSVPFPHLPQLTTLVMTGMANSHCLSLLPSIPVQCPRLSHVDLEGLCLHPNQPARAAGNDVEEEHEGEREDEGEGEGKGGRGASLTAIKLMVPFTRWLAGINHALHHDGAVHRCSPEFRHEVIAAANTEIEYVELCRLYPESARDWRMTLLLSPFRFLLAWETDATLCSAWGAIRVLDLSALQADLLTDVELVSALPPLSLLVYLLLLPFSADAGTRPPVDSEIGVIAWLRRCPRLSMLDNFTFHAAWGEAPLHLMASGVSDSLVTLGLLDAPLQMDTMTLEGSFLFDFFDPAHNQSGSSFLALQYLALPLGVTEKGRLSFKLTLLQSLPSLHSLLLRARIIP